MQNILETIDEHFASLAIVAACVYGILHFAFEYLDVKSRSIRRSEHIASFKDTVKNLSSKDKSDQLSAAILLRRYFEEKFVKNNPEYREETINVISSLLRTLPTGTLQKTLGDGLAYANDLSYADLQRTNLQDLYLGKKQGIINVEQTDMYLADLSYALLENLEGRAIFYHSILYNARIKESDLREASFIEADLKNTEFKNVKLHGANFTNAINIPSDLKKHLKDNIFADEEEFSSEKKEKRKVVFFSMPGHIKKEEDLLAREYQRKLTNMGYKVIFYFPDEYPHAGQLNRIRQDIESSSAMIAFGFKQINIEKGAYRRGEGKEDDKLEEKWLSTPWNGIEVGMGLMRGLPILLVKDIDINDGVFDQNLSECFVDTITTDTRSVHISRSPAFENWLSRF